MLAMKSGEEADDLSRRRDLWVVAGMQKVVQTCIKEEYERAGDERREWLRGCTEAGSRTDGE